MFILHRAQIEACLAYIERKVEENASELRTRSDYLDRVINDVEDEKTRRALNELRSYFEGTP